MAASVEAHQLVVAETRAGRRAVLAGLALPTPLIPPISAHRNLCGAYSAAGQLMRALVPEAFERWPELVAAHEIELLTVAPELAELMPVTHDTLTSLAIPDERTRFYSRLRTLRLSNGLVEFLRGYLERAGTEQLSLVLEDVHEADPTDQEFLAVLLRRTPPARLVLAVLVAPEWAAGLGPADPDLPPLAGDLADAAARFCHFTSQTRTLDDSAADDSAAADSAASDQTASDLELARRWVASDGVADDAACLAALTRVDPAALAELHDARADELDASGVISFRYGAVPFHRERGSEASTTGLRALAIAMDHAMLMGFYDSCIDFCHRGRAMLDPESDPLRWWTFTAKLPTSLSILGRGNEAEQLCDQTRSESQLPGLHIQFAYATAMLYTRHLDAARRDDVRATAWINIAIALSSQVADPKQRAFHSVFNSNGLALIEAHRGRPERALRLVQDGLALLDDVLGPTEHQLHRSVLRYNRAQVLAGLGRLAEALEDYRSVASVDPNYPEYHFDLGNLLRRMGREDEALLEYEAAMRLSPPFPEVYYNRADVRVGQGLIEEALADYEYVLELDPQYVDAYLNRAALLVELGRVAEAGTDVETALLLDPANPALLALRGRLAAERGDFDAARIELQRTLAAAPEYAPAWALLASVEFDAGDPDAALAALTRSIELAPEPVTLFNRGCVYESVQRWKEAIADFDRVLAEDDGEIDALVHRARCRRMLGDLAGAHADSALIVRLDPDRVPEAPEGGVPVSAR